MLFIMFLIGVWLRKISKSLVDLMIKNTAAELKNWLKARGPGPVKGV